MFLWLWQAVRGYVLIEVTGFSVERFLNLAVHRDIYVWDVTRTENGVLLKVSIKGFKLLKTCARKAKCHIRIADKMGLPFVAHRYRKRKILAGGMFFFIAVLYFFSTFLWLVEIEGNERIERDGLLRFCYSEGLKPGAFKYGINTKELEKLLLSSFPDISWISIHIKGTRAKVTIAETIPKQEMLDRSVPCNIVADKNGLITSIVTAAGTPKVKENDVVKKGDLLVSGEITIANEEGVVRNGYVMASAQVWAKMYTEINISVPFEYTEKKYTGNEKKRHYLILTRAEGEDINASDRINGLLSGNIINLLKFNTKYENYDKITERKQLRLGEDYPLPFIIVTERYREYSLEERTRTVDQAKELAEKMVTSRIIREFDFEADIVDRRLTFDQYADGLDVRAIITTNERIDQSEALVPAEQEPALEDEGST